ncbi:MAG: chemotaxis protein CheW [Novosphingobium sp.]
MTDLLLVASLGGRRVALRAAEIQSVIELDAPTPVPGAPRHIAGLSALRSRVLTVIDAGKALDLPDVAGTHRRHAAVAEVEGHLYALQLDGVEDVVEALSDCTPLRMKLEHGWARAALGMIETADGPLLVLDVGEIVAGPNDAAAVKAA